MSLHLLRTYRPALNSFTQTLRYNAFRTTECKRFMCSQKSSSKASKILTKLLITGIVAGGAVYWLKIMNDERERQNAIMRKKMLAKTALGGPFSLIDGDGKLRTRDEFKGQWLFMYFGFTHCPDICPDELEKMVKVMEILDEKGYGSRIQPIFITVDPERDTPEVVGKYIKEFSPRFIGLSGSPETVKKLCKDYRVYYRTGTPDEDNDYIVDHSIIIFLMDPEGEYVDHYGQISSAERIASGIEFQMLKYEDMKKPPSWLIPSFLFKQS